MDNAIHVDRYPHTLHHVELLHVEIPTEMSLLVLSTLKVEFCMVVLCELCILNP